MINAPAGFDAFGFALAVGEEELVEVRVSEGDVLVIC